MWYVVQTITGKEEEAAESINRILNRDGYRECFVPKRECIWRIEGTYRVHVEPLFPSYLFVESDTPDIFFHNLKRVPVLTKLLRSDEMFWMVHSDEEFVIRQMMGEDPEKIIRCSMVRLDKDGEILFAEGALKNYIGMIVKKRMRKRSVIIEIPFLGKMHRIQLGIRLEGDEQNR